MVPQNGYAHVSTDTNTVRHSKTNQCGRIPDHDKNTIHIKYEILLPNTPQLKRTKATESQTTKTNTIYARIASAMSSSCEGDVLAML